MVEEASVIYDRSGQPRLIVLTGGRLVDFDGRSIGFLDSSDAYNYEGEHRGWYVEGILRDHDGDCVGYGELVSDTTHPLLPSKRGRPIPSLVDIEPLRPKIKIIPPNPIRTVNWSTSTPISLFL